VNLWQSLTSIQKRVMGFGLIGLALAQVNQPYPDVAVLHHAPTLLALLTLPWWVKSWNISDRGLLCLFAFLVLHTIGGRYTYTSTPYDAWFEALFGHGLNPLLGWERNHYDRLVHFSFGLLLVVPVVDALRVNIRLSRRFAMYIGVEFVLGASAIYEIFEWLLSIVLAPDNVEAYNGQQGDIWDAQKDMALAFAGALTTALMFTLRDLAGRTAKDDAT